MKRVLLFLLTNILVIITLSIIANVLGINHYLTRKGIDYQSLMYLCALWGMGGAFISLLLSKVIAKWAMGVKIIDPQHAQGNERDLVQLIHQLAKKAGISTMPDVGIYPGSELNAFATGPSKNNALVAVSSGLLNSMNRDELTGVLGHEISHISNGDMVTMTLIQGVVNAFSMFLSRIAAYAIASSMNRNDDENVGSSWTYFLLTMVFDIVFTLLGSLVTAAFSRHREFRADQGSAQLTDRANMINALKRLSNAQQHMSDTEEDHRGASLATLKISQKRSWLSAFSTHPSISDRIKRLEGARVIQ